ncbi:MAG: AAA family ATPase [Acidimicrobiia bacterium]|jgi:hypothetical protein
MTTPQPLPEDDQARFDGLLAVNRAEERQVPEGWRPVDLGPVWDGLNDGSLERPTPTIGIRDDGLGLFYAGRTNTLFGPSGSGKTFCALCAAVQTIEQGGNVAWIDFEDDAIGTISRLIELGADRRQVLGHFHYINPVDRLSSNDRGRFVEWVKSEGFALVVIDSIGEWGSLNGVNARIDHEVNEFLRENADAIARTGSGVISLDHTPHSTPDRPIDSQRKIAKTSGAMYQVETVRELGRGQKGVLRLISRKDRGGHYPRGTVAAEFTLDATTTPYTHQLASPRRPETSEILPGEKPAVQRVYKILAAADGPLTNGEIQELTGHDDSGWGFLTLRSVQDATTTLHGLELIEREGEKHSGYRFNMPAGASSPSRDQTLDLLETELGAQVGGES